MLFQLRNGRQQLPALMTTERQLQELRHPIWDSHVASLLYHLNHSCRERKEVQSPVTLESQYKTHTYTKRKYLTPNKNMPGMLKLVNLTHCWEYGLDQILNKQPISEDDYIPSRYTHTLGDPCYYQRLITVNIPGYLNSTKYTRGNASFYIYSLVLLTTPDMRQSPSFCPADGRRDKVLQSFHIYELQ